MCPRRGLCFHRPGFQPAATPAGLRELLRSTPGTCGRRSIKAMDQLYPRLGPPSRGGKPHVAIDGSARSNETAYFPSRSAPACEIFFVPKARRG